MTTKLKFTTWKLGNPQNVDVLEYARLNDISEGIKRARNGEPSLWVKVTA